MMAVLTFFLGAIIGAALVIVVALWAASNLHDD